MTDKERISAHLKLLTDFTYQGLVHFRIWKRLIGMDGWVTDDEKTGKEMAPVFFAMSQKAHFETAFMHLARLVDVHDDTTNIGHFLRCVASEPKVFHKTEYEKIIKGVACDQNHLDGLRNSLMAIKKRRDKFYAHIDRSLIKDTQKVFREWPLRAAEMENAFTLVGEILNKYSVFLDKSTTVMGIIGEEDITKLLRYVGLQLREDKEERRKKWSRKSLKNHS